jgi:anthranilate/para-aminobenzoate synthase component I
MDVTTSPIPTDLLTPLGAYLRLRAGAPASFLLESVEQGRLGRHSFIGSGSRLVTFDEAETLDEPIVGYLSYDHVAKLEPTVPLPADGAGLPESRFVVAETLVRFDHGSGTAEVLAGDPDTIAARLETELVLQEHNLSVSGEEPISASPSSSSRKRYGDGLTRRSAR